LEILKEQTELKTFGDLSVPFFVPATKLDTFQSVVFSKYTTPEVYLDFALQATSAAPTYFDTVDGYVDGALWANNPSLVAYTLYKKYENLNPEEISIISIGTSGVFNDYENILKNSNFWTPLSWATPIIKYSIKNTEDYNHFILENLGIGKYFRIYPVLKKIYKLDGFKQLKEYAEIWDEVYNVNKNLILEELEIIMRSKK
jgi:patatin-like phospholipase/acyl hydrolase